jgi:hypothetical protein
MCLFCAAIPAALAIGARAKARQDMTKVEAQAQQEPAPRPALPAVPATAVVVAGLVAASVIYHTQQGG